MSYYRYQNSNYLRPSLFGGFRFFPPVIKWLLIGNVGAWLLVSLFLRPFTIGGVQIGGNDGLLFYYLALWPIDSNFWPWQLATYMFMHGGFVHLLFNMFALWMFGMELENTWGAKKFLTYYLLCGVGAGISNLFIGPLFGPSAPTVGASGAVYGVLIAFGMIFPDRPIFVYFLLPIRARYFVILYIVLELYAGITGTADGIAHFAHLGGAAVGFVYLMIDRGSLPLSAFWQRSKRPSSRSARVGSFANADRDAISEAKYYDIHEEEERINQERIDEILDKISQNGYQSLSEDEKRVLFEASKKLN